MTRTSAKPAALGPRSLGRVLRVLQEVAHHPEGLNLTQLSQLADAPKSSLLAILRPLAEQNFLNHNANKYTLGASSFGLAASILKSLKLPQLARPFLVELARQTGEAVLLGTLDPKAGSIVYVDKVDDTGPFTLSVPIGTSRPLYCSAGGRALLAFQPEKWIDSYIRNVTFEKMTAKSVVKKDVLLEKLRKVRQTGVSLSDSEVTMKVSGLASPVFDINGNAFAAVVIAGPEDRCIKNRAMLLQNVRKSAAAISTALGYRPVT